MGCAMSNSELFQNEGAGFYLLEGVLTELEIRGLIELSQAHLETQNPIPSYVLLEQQNHKTVQKIQSVIETFLGDKIHYLNDFYLYTDSEFGSGWHMDTELFTFKRAINAWVLLSPEKIKTPLACLETINSPDQDYYHTCKVRDDAITFVNLTTGASVKTTVDEVNSQSSKSPDVSVGDILLLNPKYFHKTHTQESKHVLALKYLVAEEGRFFSDAPVPDMYWPEITIFKNLISKHEDWNEVLVGLKSALTEPKSRAALSMGFFPEKIDYYRENLRKLV